MLTRSKIIEIKLYIEKANQFPDSKSSDYENQIKELLTEQLDETYSDLLSKKEYALIEYLTSLIDPENYTCGIYSARCCMEKKEYPKALDFYKNTLKFKQDDFECLLGIARCMYLLKHYKEAFEAFKILEKHTGKTFACLKYIPLKKIKDKTSEEQKEEGEIQIDATENPDSDLLQILAPYGCHELFLQLFRYGWVNQIYQTNNKNQTLLQIIEESTYISEDTKTEILTLLINYGLRSISKEKINLKSNKNSTEEKNQMDTVNNELSEKNTELTKNEHINIENSIETNINNVKKDEVKTETTNEKEKELLKNEKPGNENLTKNTNNIHVTEAHKNQTKKKKKKKSDNIATDNKEEIKTEVTKNDTKEEKKEESKNEKTNSLIWNIKSVKEMLDLNSNEQANIINKTDDKGNTSLLCILYSTTQTANLDKPTEQLISLLKRYLNTIRELHDKDYINLDSVIELLTQANAAQWTPIHQIAFCEKIETKDQILELYFPELISYWSDKEKNSTLLKKLLQSLWEQKTRDGFVPYIETKLKNHYESMTEEKVSTNEEIFLEEGEALAEQAIVHLSEYIKSGKTGYLNTFKEILDKNHEDIENQLYKLDENHKSFFFDQLEVISRSKDAKTRTKQMTRLIETMQNYINEPQRIFLWMTPSSQGNTPLNSLMETGVTDILSLYLNELDSFNLESTKCFDYLVNQNKENRTALDSIHSLKEQEKQKITRYLTSITNSLKKCNKETAKQLISKKLLGVIKNKTELYAFVNNTLYPKNNSKNQIQFFSKNTNKMHKSEETLKKDSDEMYTKGVSEYNKQNYEKALNNFSKAVYIDDMGSKIYYETKCYIGLDEPKKAFTYFLSLLSIYDKSNSENKKLTNYLEKLTKPLFKLFFTIKNQENYNTFMMGFIELLSREGTPKSVLNAFHNTLEKYPVSSNEDLERKGIAYGVLYSVFLNCYNQIESNSDELNSGKSKLLKERIYKIGSFFRNSHSLREYDVLARAHLSCIDFNTEDMNYIYSALESIKVNEGNENYTQTVTDVLCQTAIPKYWEILKKNDENNFKSSEEYKKTLPLYNLCAKLLNPLTSEVNNSKKSEDEKFLNSTKAFSKYLKMQSTYLNMHNSKKEINFDDINNIDYINN